MSPSKRNATKAATALAGIERARQKGIEISRKALAEGQELKDVKDSWPVHAMENRPTTADIRPPIEGEARMAYARQAAGIPLSPRDEYVLAKYPDGGPWQSQWEEVCRHHRRLVDDET